MPKYRTVIVLAYEYEAKNRERAEAIAVMSFKEEYGKSAHDVAIEVKTEEEE